MSQSQTISSVIFSHTGLRGIAAMSVVLVHLNTTGEAKNWCDQRILLFFLSPGYAVDLFFILSGFILNWCYVSNTGAMNWSFYLRARIARIIPLYYLTLLSFGCVSIISLLRHGTSYVGSGYPWTLFSNIFMLSGILAGPVNTINMPAWSISIEFFCYLIVFPALFLAGKYLQNKHYETVVSIILTMVFTQFLVLSYSLTKLPFYHGSWDGSWLGRGVFGFSLGFFLSSIFRKTLSWSPRLWIINSVVFSTIGCFVLVRLGVIPMQIILYAFPFLVYFTAFDRGVIASLLKWNPLQWLGERSYSIYLWHFPIIVWFLPIAKLIQIHLKQCNFLGLVNCFLVIGFIITVAEISYRYFEKPCRDYIRKLGNKTEAMNLNSEKAPPRTDQL